MYVYVYIYIYIYIYIYHKIEIISPRKFAREERKQYSNDENLTLAELVCMMKEK